MQFFDGQDLQIAALLPGRRSAIDLYICRPLAIQIFFLHLEHVERNFLEKKIYELNDVFKYNIKIK